MRDVTDYLDKKNVVFLKAETRDEALAELVDHLAASKKLKDKEAFFDAVIAREKIVSTGIGMGVAIPHAKLNDYKDFFISIGIQKKGIPWDALDGAPVRLIFLVGGPDNRQTEYLQILSRLTVTLKDQDRREQLLNLEDPKQIVELFASS